jgi:hypothetical protein
MSLDIFVKRGDKSGDKGGDTVSTPFHSQTLENKSTGLLAREANLAQEPLRILLPTPLQAFLFTFSSCTALGALPQLTLETAAQADVYSGNGIRVSCDAHLFGACRINGKALLPYAHLTPTTLVMKRIQTAMRYIAHSVIGCSSTLIG